MIHPPECVQIMEKTFKVNIIEDSKAAAMKVRRQPACRPCCHAVLPAYMTPSLLVEHLAQAARGHLALAMPSYRVMCLTAGWPV